MSMSTHFRSDWRPTIEESHEYEDTTTQHEKETIFLLFHSLLFPHLSSRTPALSCCNDFLTAASSRLSLSFIAISLCVFWCALFSSSILFWMWFPFVFVGSLFAGTVTSAGMVCGIGGCLGGSGGLVRRFEVVVVVFWSILISECIIVVVVVISISRFIFRLLFYFSLVS